MRRFYIYILASKSRVLYVGVTNDLRRRLFEHRHATTGFTGRYRVRRLVYFEETSDVHSALNREKQLKGWKRARKIALIESGNSEWHDLAEGWD